MFAAEGTDRGTIRLRPIPVLFQIGRLNDVTAITRHWANGDETRCQLCPECTADGHVCTVLTEEDVGEENAPGYSTLGLGREEFPVRAFPVLGLRG